MAPLKLPDAPGPKDSVDAVTWGIQVAQRRQARSVEFDWWDAYKAVYLPISVLERRRLGLIFDTIKQEQLSARQPRRRCGDPCKHRHLTWQC